MYMCVYVFMCHVYNVYYPTETCCPRRAHAINLTQLSMSGCSAGQINTNDAASSEGPHELALGRDSQSCAVQVRWEHGLGKKIILFFYFCHGNWYIDFFAFSGRNQFFIVDSIAADVTSPTGPGVCVEHGASSMLMVNGAIDLSCKRMGSTGTIWRLEDLCVWSNL